MADDPVEPPGLKGRQYSGGPNRRYTQAELDSIIQRSLREQADAYAFSGLKKEVDRLLGVANQFQGSIDKLVKDLGEVTVKIEEHIQEPMHEGTRKLIADLGVDELSHDQRQLLAVVLKAADLQHESQQTRDRFWASWQIRLSIFMMAASALISTCGLFLHLIGK